MGQAMNIEATIDLFERFKAAAGGDASIGGMLTLAHAQLAAKPQPAATPRYLNAEQAAEYLGCTVKSLYRQVELGRLVPLRGPKRSYRFTVGMLDRYLAA